MICVARSKLWGPEGEIDGFQRACLRVTLSLLQSPNPPEVCKMNVGRSPLSARSAEKWDVMSSRPELGRKDSAALTQSSSQVAQ